MNDHKRFKRPHRRPVLIDGIVGGSGRLGVPSHNSYYQPNRDSATPTLGEAGKLKDGFNPSRAVPYPTIGQAEAQESAMLEEPIVLDHTAPKTRKKRRWFGLRKAKDATKHRSRKRKFFKRLALALAALLIIAGAYFAVKLYITQKNIFKGGGKAPALAQNIDISQLKGEGDGRINILVLGIGGPGHDGPDLTDTVMLMSIDPVNHTAALLSIPRDLCVKAPCGPNQKINAIYALAKQSSSAKNVDGQIQAGLDKLDTTLTSILGVNIHYHAIVDFSAFKQAIDTVGGIDVNVPEQLYDPTIAWENNYNSVIAQKGLQHMNGQKALLYAKSRETSSDFARGERQRLVIVALKNKVFTLGTFSNPLKVSSLLTSLGQGVYTDFSLSEISRLYTITGQIPSSAITSLDMVTPPHDLLVTGTYDGSTSIVRPKAGLFDYSAIQTFVRTSLRDGFLAKENAKVAVYNATDTAGLATSQAALLKTYGYNVTTVASTSPATNPALTTIVDLSKGADKYTRHYLEGRYGVTAVSKLPGGSNITPPVGTRFVIILGKDVANSTQ